MPKEKSSDEQTVDNFIKTFGSKRKDKGFTDEVEKVSLHFIDRFGNCGNNYNSLFRVMQNLIIYGVPYKPKAQNVKGHWTEPKKMIKLIDSIRGKPRNPIAVLRKAVKNQTTYLP